MLYHDYTKDSLLTSWLPPLACSENDQLCKGIAQPHFQCGTGSQKTVKSAPSAVPLIYYYLSHFIDLFCLFYLSFFLCLNKLVINWPSPRVLSFCHSVRAQLCDSLHQVIGTFCLHDFSHFSHRQVLLKHWYREFEIKKKIASMFLLLFLLMCTCDLADVFPCSSAKTSNITPIKKAMNMTVSLTSLLSDCQLNT